LQEVPATLPRAGTASAGGTRSDGHARNSPRRLLQLQNRTGGSDGRAIDHVQALQHACGPADYTITNATSKNFKTKGRFVIQEGAYLFNTDTIASEVVLKGRFLGKLTAEKSLEIYNTAELKGTFTANLLVIPAGQRFRWSDALQNRGADIAGELVAHVRAKQTVTLRSTARFFVTSRLADSSSSLAPFSSARPVLDPFENLACRE